MAGVEIVGTTREKRPGRNGIYDDRGMSLN